MAYPANPIYKFLKDPLTNEVVTILKQIGDSEPFIILNIPLNEANTDYQEYLEWAKTNTAEEAD